MIFPQYVSRYDPFKWYANNKKSIFISYKIQKVQNNTWTSIFAVITSYLIFLHVKKDSFIEIYSS